MKTKLDQPAPKQSKGDIWEMVIADMEDRCAVGIVRYGTPLQVNNGRHPIIDAYQEALDQAVYLRQFIEENNLVPCDTDGVVITTRDLRTKYHEFAAATLRMLNRNILMAYGDDKTRNTELATIDNWKVHLDAFEHSLYAFMIGVKP